MYITNTNQQNRIAFNGYIDIKVVNGKLVKAKQGSPGSVKLFVAGGSEVDKKVAQARKEILKSSFYKENVKHDKPDSVGLCFSRILSPIKEFFKSLN